MTETATRWQLQGTVGVACNCDYGCPCNFNALPSKGKCEGQWTWHVERRDPARRSDLHRGGELARRDTRGEWGGADPV